MGPWRYRLMRVVRTGTACCTIWGYLLLAPLGCAGFAIMAVVWRKDPILRTRRLQRAMAGAYAFLHHWMRLVRGMHFDPRQKLVGLPDGPMVVVANHPTLCDITAITALLGGACSMVKPSLYRRRLLHRMLAATGHIEGQGPGLDHERTRLLVEESVGWLRAGFPLVVFPEGTRSKAGQLRRFGRTAFEIAARADVPVVALTIVSDPPYLTKEVSAYFPPVKTSRLTIELLEIFEPGDAGGDSRTLRRAVEGRYRAWSQGTKPPGRNGEEGVPCA